MNESFHDSFGAFCPGPRVCLEGATTGPLAGLTFAAKDNFDVAGHITGAGSPDWQRSHRPAHTTAAAITRLVEAGARLVGKTQMDELAYGVLGENAHYGTPRNPAAPDRVPGGSSSGSASAVAGGLVDFALGSDSACSVRLPAALCGLFGIRPTLGRVSTDGLLPLSPSLDTVGWFTRTPELLQQIGSILLDASAEGPRPTTLLIAEDAFALAQPRITQALQPAGETIAAHFGAVRRVRIVEADASFGLEWFWFRVWSVQVCEVWAIHGDWILHTKPDSTVLSPETLATGAHSTPTELAEARAVWQELRETVRRRIPDGAVLCLPTVTDCAPQRGSAQTTRRAFSRPTLCLMSIAGVAGLPQITLPAAAVDGCPVGLSLVGGEGADEHLLQLAVALMGGPNPLLRRSPNQGVQATPSSVRCAPASGRA
jgi:amidase